MRGGIYQLLGTLCEVYPELMVGHSGRLVEVYVRTLRSEMLGKGSKKPEMSIIGGCLRGLCSYLVNFSQSFTEGVCVCVGLNGLGAATRRRVFLSCIHSLIL